MFANALQLDEAEREHLQALAHSARPAATRAATRLSPATVRPVIQQVLDAITEAPQLPIRNARHDILAMEPALARALYSPVLDSAVAKATAKRAAMANTTRFIYLDLGACPRVLRRLRPDGHLLTPPPCSGSKQDRNPHDKKPSSP